jgi:hypothetical protein
MLRASLALLALGACTGGMHDPSTVEQQNGACIALEGRTFASLQELECGRTPDGVAQCHWQLVFATRDTTASEFAWSYSDVSEGGRVECLGQRITAFSASRILSGTFDSSTQMLNWAGETYVASP